jgi:hypothetical protein
MLSLVHISYGHVTLVITYMLTLECFTSELSFASISVFTFPELFAPYGRFKASKHCRLKQHLISWFCPPLHRTHRDRPRSIREQGSRTHPFLFWTTTDMIFRSNHDPTTPTRTHVNGETNLPRRMRTRL